MFIIPIVLPPIEETVGIIPIVLPPIEETVG